MIAADEYDPGGTGVKDFSGAFPAWSMGTLRRFSREDAAAERERFQIDARVGEDRRQRDDDRAADRRVTLQLEAVDRRDEIFAILRGRLGDGRSAGEGHDADAHVGRLLLYESLRGGLRREEPARLDVGRLHAARHVDRENDRALVGRQPHRRARTRDRDDRRDHRQQENERRDMAPQPLARAHRLVHEAQARVAHGVFFLAPQEEHVRAGERRRSEQQPQHVGPDESHGLTLAPTRRAHQRAARAAARIRARGVSSVV